MYSSQSDIDFENPRSLFKYRAFDQNALQCLVDGTVWLAAPQSFNDPFDCMFFVDRSDSDDELLAHLNRCAQSRGESTRFSLDDVPRERPHYEEVLERLKHGVRNAGLYCLAATPFEPLMWAHYSDGHRGFCIEYERIADNDLGRSDCSRVSYVDPAFSAFRGLDFLKEPPEVLHRIFTSKAHSWSYEHEWRLVRMWKGEPTDRSYRLNARILSVTFGLRMPRRNALTIVRLLRRSEGIQFHEMVSTQEQLTLLPVPFRFSPDEIDT